MRDDEGRPERVFSLDARASEHIVEEDLVLWAYEEAERLYQEHPDGIPGGLLVKAVTARARREDWTFVVLTANVVDGQHRYVIDEEPRQHLDIPDWVRGKKT